MVANINEYKLALVAQAQDLLWLHQHFIHFQFGLNKSLLVKIQIEHIFVGMKALAEAAICH